MTHKVLVVEDDPDIADLIRVNLHELGIETTVETNGKSGLESALNGQFDLLLLDVMLPEMNGLDICRSVRAELPQQAILMLTAKNSEMDRVLGLELGADDYMTKPFSVRELQARIRSHLRRIEVFRQNAEQTTSSSTISVGNLAINTSHHSIQINAQELDVTAKEFELMLHLAKHPNQVFSRAQLLERVWGYHHSGYEHTVNSHINRLRAKVEKDATSPKIIETVWGVGYKLNPEGLTE